jgi:hypothetical protein
MECMKLKDENSRTLHLLKKSDNKVKELESDVYKTRSFNSSRDE